MIQVRQFEGVAVSVLTCDAGRCDQELRFSLETTGKDCAQLAVAMGWELSVRLCYCPGHSTAIQSTQANEPTRLTIDKPVDKPRLRSGRKPGSII